MAKSVQGLAELKRKLAALPKETRSEIKKALTESAEEIVAFQKRLVPAQSGDLRNSIGFTFGKYRAENANVRGISSSSGAEDDDLSVTIHAGDGKAFYAAWVEFGTAPHEQPNNPRIGFHHRGANARPFFFPAYRALKRKIKGKVTRATRKAARKAAAAGQ